MVKSAHCYDDNTFENGDVRERPDRPYVVLRWRRCRRRRWLEQAYIVGGAPTMEEGDAPSLPTRSAIVMRYTGKKRGMSTALGFPPARE